MRLEPNRYHTHCGSCGACLDVELTEADIFEGCQVICPRCSVMAVLKGTSNPRNLSQSSLEELLQTHKLVSLKKINLGAISFLPNDTPLGLKTWVGILINRPIDVTFLGNLAASIYRDIYQKEPQYFKGKNRYTKSEFMCILPMMLQRNKRLQAIFEEWELLTNV